MKFSRENFRCALHLKHLKNTIMRKNFYGTYKKHKSLAQQIFPVYGSWSRETNYDLTEIFIMNILLATS